MPHSGETQGIPSLWAFTAGFAPISDREDIWVPSGAARFYCPALVILYTDEKVDAYRMSGNSGSIARPTTPKASRPELMGDQVRAPSVLLNTPSPSIPTYKTLWFFGLTKTEPVRAV